MSTTLSAQLLIQFPANVSCKAAEDGPRSWASATIWETHIEFLASGCSLAQPWLVWLAGD